MKEKQVTTLPQCDFCSKRAEYDGKTVAGPWASMCAAHFARYGTGLELGRGQKLTAVIDYVELDRAEFEKWMRAVDRHVQSEVGLSCHDLPDACYWDYFADGTTAADMAFEVIADAMDEVGFDL